MGTRLLPHDDVEPEGAPYVTRFAGTIGGARGVCYQVDDERGNYVVLSLDQAERVVVAIARDIIEQRRDRPCSGG
jgi:hypothetical protein